MEVLEDNRMTGFFMIKHVVTIRSKRPIVETTKAEKKKKNAPKLLTY